MDAKVTDLLLNHTWYGVVIFCIIFSSTEVQMNQKGPREEIYQKKRLRNETRQSCDEVPSLSEKCGSKNKRRQTIEIPTPQIENPQQQFSNSADVGKKSK